MKRLFVGLGVIVVFGSSFFAALVGLGFVVEPYMGWVPSIRDATITGLWRHLYVGFIATMTLLMAVAVTASAAGGCLTAGDWWLRRSQPGVN